MFKKITPDWSGIGFSKRPPVLDRLFFDALKGVARQKSIYCAYVIANVLIVLKKLKQRYVTE